MAGTRKCCVKGCPAKSASGLSYFSLPAESDRRLKWLQAIGRPDIKIDALKPNDYFVCSIHFEKRQVRVLKQFPPDLIPTRNVPRIRKGVAIIASTTATQTDFSSDDSDNDGNIEFVNTNKRKRTFDDGAKVIVYKRSKPNRKVFQCSEIQCNDNLELRPNDPDAAPMQMFVESRNLPRDRINASNRKIFVLTEEESVAKRNDIELVFEVPLNTYKVPLLQSQMSEVIANSDSPSNTEGIIRVNNLKGNNDLNRAESVSEVSLSYTIENETLKKFMEWKDITGSRRRWPKFDRDFKMFALNLHTINSRAYKILMDAWKLPKENELKNIQLKIGTKFDEQMIRLLGQKFASLTNEAKYCILNVYSKPLKPHLYYDAANDEIIGMHKMKGFESKAVANHAFVATVKGIQVSWHQPVAFSLTCTKDADILEGFIKNVCLILKEMGLKVLGIVVSDDPFVLNYCRTKQFMSPAKHFITVENDKIFLVFDIPHILNRLKNNIITNDFLFDSNIISWKYVKQVYDLDKEKGGRLLSKLTDEHLEIDYKDKSLEVPCEVFSRKVSSAIKFYSEHGLMPAEAVPTSQFIKKLNDVLDVLNRKKLSKLPNLKSALVHVKANCRALDEGVSFMKKLKPLKNNENKKELDISEIFIISLKSLGAISGCLRFRDQKGLALTRGCYLEAMLDFLKEIEEDAGVKRPSPIQFTRAFSKLFLKYLIDLTPPPKSVGNMSDFLKKADGIKDCFDIYDGERICLKDTDYRFSLPKQYAIIYVASYLIYKCSKRHTTCEKYKNYHKDLIDLNKTKTYVHFEDYNKEAAFYNELKLPAFKFVSYVDKLDERFIKDFYDYYHVYPAESIYKSLMSVPKCDIPCQCFPLAYMLKLFVRTRIYQTMVYNTQRLKDRSSFNSIYVMEVQKL